LNQESLCVYGLGERTFGSKRYLSASSGSDTAGTTRATISAARGIIKRHASVTTVPTSASRASVRAEVCGGSQYRYEKIWCECPLECCSRDSHRSALGTGSANTSGATCSGQAGKSSTTITALTTDA
jgi:hypothetical protein